MDNNQIWLILYQALLSGGLVDMTEAATLADLALERYLDRFGGDS